MKKILCFVTSLAMCGMFVVGAQATNGINENEKSIMDNLKSSVTVEGKTVNVPSEYVVAAEKYFATDGIDLTADDASVVNEQINNAKAVIVENKITDLKTMNKASQDKILGYAKIAANKLGVTLEIDYSAKTIIVKDKNGKVLLIVEKTVKNTGDDYTSVLLISGFLAMVLAGAGVMASKKGYFAK